MAARMVARLPLRASSAPSLSTPLAAMGRHTAHAKGVNSMALQKGLTPHESRQAEELLKRIRARGGMKEALRMERLARRGKLHPDPEIAALAVQWARLVLSVEPLYARLERSRWLRVCAFVVEIVSVGFVRDFSGSVHERRSRRLAQRIMHASLSG